MHDTEPAAAPGQHPFPLRRDERRAEASGLVINIILGAALIIWSAGKLRELIDQAERDCERVERYRQAERADRYRQAARAGRKHGRRARPRW